MAKYECKVCGYIYNEQYAGSPFSEVDSCPICAAAKSEFRQIDEFGNEVVEAVEDTVEEVAEETVSAPVEEVAEINEEVSKDGPVSAPVVEPLFGYKEEPKVEEVPTAESVMENRFNGFAIEKRQEFWKVEEETVENADRSSIETYYGDTEPVGMGSEEEEKEPEENFRPLWRTGEGTGTVQTVITPENAEPVIEEPVFEKVEPVAPFFEEVKEEATVEDIVEEPVFEEPVFEEPVVEDIASSVEEVVPSEDEDLFEFVEIPAEDTDGLDSVAFGGNEYEVPPVEAADVVSVESMFNETFFNDDEDAEEEIASEFTEIIEEEPVAEEIIEEVVEEPAVEETIEEVVEEPAAEEIIEEVVEEPVVEEIIEEVIEEPTEEPVEDFNGFVDPFVVKEEEPAEPEEEIVISDGQAMTEEELYAEIFGTPYVPEQPVEEVSEEIEEVVEEPAAEEIAEEVIEEPVIEETVIKEAIETEEDVTVEEAVEDILEDIIDETPASDSDVEIEFYDADEGVEEIMFEGEENIYATPVASEEDFEEITEEVVETNSVYEEMAAAEDIVEEVITNSDEDTTVNPSEEMVVYSMLKGGMKYSVLCDEQAKKVFSSYQTGDEAVSNGLENIILLPAQLNPLPLPANAEVDTTTILGALTGCPVEVLQPFCFSKLFLWGEHIPNNDNAEEYNNQAFVLVKGKNGHIPNVMSKEELKEEVEIARERFNGTPVGIDLIAGRVEQDLEACVYANMDYVILNDVSSRILPYALRRAKNYLNKVNAKLDLIVCVDALKDAQELAKLLALGADFVLVERGFDLEFANKITEDLKEIARSTGHDNVHDINMFDICTVDSDIATYTDIAHI